MDRNELIQLRAKARDARSDLFKKKTVIQCVIDGGSVMNGAKETLARLRQLAEGNEQVVIKVVGGFGAMWMEPTIFISKPGSPRILYGHVDPARAEELWKRYVLGGDPCADYAFAWLKNTAEYPDFRWGANEEPAWKGIPHVGSTDWGRLQQRIVLRNCGEIDPESIEDYIASNGYAGLEKAIFEMNGDEIVSEVKASGLRGRGGAGFSMGTKWETVRSIKRTPRYAIVNGHEGEPNVFKDRRIFEGDPHSVLEGLLIGCVATNIPEAYIYVGSEHPLSYKRMGKAVEDARKMGLLGDNILGSGITCDVKVIIAAGAYISGEASAMMYGIQGTRGMPRVKPPRSAEAGLWGQPTLVNNVESFNNAPEIILKGAAWYASFGTPKSKGTKVISLSGPFARTCLAEIPFGGPTRDAIEVIAGGPADPAHPIRAVQTGSVSGGCFPPSMYDIPFDIDAYGKKEYATLLGSGSLTAITDQQCIVDAAYYVLRFNRDESCGKCIPCRIGCEGITEMLWRIMNGDGKEADIAKLEGLSKMVIEHSICGLGQAAPLPILNMLYFDEFKQELLQHIKSGYCKANVCPMAHRPVEVWSGDALGVEASHNFERDGKVGYDYALPGAAE
ncbi:MAG TPA: NADH-ubiquinone oxidoreductase-F iron-sulfur binding region domain-containing protein [Chloroflexia bacterium]|nr:NADH-ubiquinone oxidoreductase-F iron-sulfur binding region domain-containing protein [Chloroflexia bacterium]